MMSKKTLTEMHDRSGATYHCHLVGDRTYPDFPPWHDGDYGVFLDVLRNLDMKKEDVFITGCLKSGNHWFYEVISMAAQQSTDYATRTLADDFADLKSANDLAVFVDKPEPVQLYSHMSLKDIPTSIEKNGTKVIYILRNFKDVVTSAYHFMTILTKLLPYKGKWEDFLELNLNQPGYCYGTWFDHIKEADEYHKQHPNVPFHVLCYELMKADPVGEIKKLCTFLEVPDTNAEAIADKVHFSKMRPAVMAGKIGEWVKEVCEEGSKGLFRKGVIGDWKNMFTVAQSETVDKMFLEQLSDSPLAQIIKPYMLDTVPK